jgi:hypothetical protein
MSSSPTTRKTLVPTTRVARFARLGYTVGELAEGGAAEGGAAEGLRRVTGMESAETGNVFLHRKPAGSFMLCARLMARVDARLLMGSHVLQ